ncbi:alpha/beta hydrolase [Deltaproteobacteria bacterium]|nr:alpha/beta hydrolase [Deltaproteobacteria bacterium]
MEVIQFSHANGFPAKTYSYMFDQLKEYKISAVNIIGDSTDHKDINMFDLRDELIQNVLQHGEPVIGVGHSFGGVLTLLAASNNPELFKNIVLLDPPIFSPIKITVIKILRMLGIEDWVSPAGKSKKRRDKFASKRDAKTLFMSNKLFKNFHPQILNDYVTHGLKKNKNGVELTIPVVKEIAIFHNSLILYSKCLRNVKGSLIYGATNPILWASDLSWINHNFVNLKLLPFPGSHLFPFENPKSTALMIKRCL